MSYEQDVLAWRKDKDEQLRADDGWLTLVGLFWLQDGDNEIGSGPESHILLPGHSPERLGILHFEEGQATLTITCDEPVLIDNVLSKGARLRDDSAAEGPTLVQVGRLTFFVIKRGEHYGVRVRDLNNPSRQTFTGRTWFAIDAACRVTARFFAYPTPRRVEVINSVGLLAPMDNSGYVEFSLNGQRGRLEAFVNENGDLWFIFKDQTSGPLTYKAGRFLIAPQSSDGNIDLDFNKAYHPPCAFTVFATCPLPPRENHLPFAVEAGERLSASSGAPNH